ncbi:hypothetical protein ACIPYS_06505 [Kitasatospora sp. NPDC089913]|uniref:hypothetical protein n=1 Tax=Kitasatospora sp. NPDC089913 TaxID=3364080 RepID=UPI0038241ACE
MFTAKTEVLIVSCEDRPEAVGRTGRIVDEVPPGPLTGHRWTVRLGWLEGSALCHPHEIRPTGN